MDHGGHGGMDHSMPGMPDHSPSSLPCKMSMLWNTSPTGICLVFPSLQITASPFSLLFYLAFITLLALSCEYLRLALTSFDRQLRSELRGGLGPVSNGAAGVGGRPSTPIGGMRRPSALHLDAGADEALLGARGSVAGIGGAQGRYWGVVRLPFFLQVRRSLGYALHVALTFYIMLLVMSYNAQIISAIVFGAFLGHFIFQRNLDIGVGVDDTDGKGLQCH